MTLSHGDAAELELSKSCGYLEAYNKGACSLGEILGAFPVPPNKNNSSVAILKSPCKGGKSCAVRCRV